MDRLPISIDDALEQMQTETRSRGLLHLQTIFGSLFSKDTLIQALESFSLNVEDAAIYLQDNLPESSNCMKINKIDLKEENIELKLEDKEIITNEIKTIPGPTSGKIALEFSLSSQYIDSTVPVFYVVDEILKEIFSFLYP